MFDFLDIFFAGMMVVFIIVAGVGMTNAILLSVQNRVRDLGTLRAIALTSRQAGGLIYAETFIIGAASAVCSFCAAMIAVALLESWGLGIAFELTDIGSALPSSIRPSLFPLRLLVIALISAIFPIVAAALPARTARKLTIRECFAS